MQTKKKTYKKTIEALKLATVVQQVGMISGNCFSSLSRISLVALGGIAGNNSGFYFKSPGVSFLFTPMQEKGLRPSFEGHAENF